ncbi:Phosphate-selective porin O and P [Opitutaceae bacterium TAV1]|nr:Phosphate-selective porin O and P [Opitutaceae bacterium TAV1]
MNRYRKLTTAALLAAATTFGPVAPARADEAALQKQINDLQDVVRQLQTQLAADRAEREKVLESARKASAAESAPVRGHPPGVPGIDPSVTSLDSGRRDTFTTSGSVPATAGDLDSVRDQIGDQLDRRLRVRNGVGVVVNGSAIVRYTDDENPNTSRGFTIPSASIGFSGSLRSDPVDEGDVTYSLSFNYGTGSSTTVQDAWVQWSLKSLGKGDIEPLYTLAFTLGQQAVLFGNDNTGNEETRPTINTAGYLGEFRTRDIGLTATGGFDWHYDASAPAGLDNVPTIAYLFGLFNGNGTGVDENDDKALVGKLVYAPFTRYNTFFQGLKFGYSRIQWDSASGAGRIENKLNSVHVEWLKLPFLVTAEYVWGEGWDERGAGFGPAVDKDDFIFTLFYRPGKLPDFEPLFRYDRFRQNKSRSDDGLRETYTLGFNYYWWQVDPVVRRTYETTKTERVIKLQVNYNFVKDDTTAFDDNQLLTQLVFNF